MPAIYLYDLYEYTTCPKFAYQNERHWVWYESCGKVYRYASSWSEVAVGYTRGLCYKAGSGSIPPSLLCPHGYTNMGYGTMSATICNSNSKAAKNSYCSILHAYNEYHYSDDASVPVDAYIVFAGTKCGNTGCCRVIDPAQGDSCIPGTNACSSSNLS